jgi:peptide/nickel transport system substrate-binding protein
VVQQASANPPADAEIAFTYWIEDYPYPSDFLPLLFGCSATRTGDSTNLSAGGFCDPGLDREMARALRTQATDPTRAAAAWARADREVTNAAPWVPLFTADNVDLLSRRVGNYEYSPQLLVLLDQLWVR